MPWRITTTSGVLDTDAAGVVQSTGFDGTAPTSTIDSYEDGGISEYNGNTGAYSVVSDRASDGTYALYHQHNGGGPVSLYTTSFSTSPGNKYEWDFYTNSGGSGKPCFRFGGSGTDSYGVEASSQDDALKIGVVSGTSGASYSNLNKKSMTVPTGEWATVAVTWKSDGTITAELFDSAGNSVGTVSTTDSTYGSGGLGWRYDSAYSPYTWHDYIRETPL